MMETHSILKHSSFQTKKSLRILFQNTQSLYLDVPCSVITLANYSSPGHQLTSVFPKIFHQSGNVYSYLLCSHSPFQSNKRTRPHSCYLLQPGPEFYFLQFSCQYTCPTNIFTWPINFHLIQNYHLFGNSVK